MTITPNGKFQIPDSGERNWNGPMDDNLAVLEGSITKLMVTSHELPSASLNVDVAPGTMIDSSDAYVDYAGVTSHAIAASSVVKLWLTNAGVLASGASWPTAGTKHVRLATVTTSGTVVTSIVDERISFKAAG